MSKIKKMSLTSGNNTCVTTSATQMRFFLFVNDFNVRFQSAFFTKTPLANDANKFGNGVGRI